jgi:hypothetical protein
MRPSLLFIAATVELLLRLILPDNWGLPHCFWTLSAAETKNIVSAGFLENPVAIVVLLSVEIFFGSAKC